MIGEIKYIEIDGTEHPIDSKKLNNVDGGDYQINDNLVTTLSSESTSSQYPSAACLYRIVGDLSEIDGSSESEELSSQTYTLSLAVTAGLGTITGAEGGTYPAGTNFTVTAVDGAGIFVKWSDGDTNRIKSFVLNSDLLLSAEFKLNTYIDDPGEIDYPTFDDLL